MGQASEGEKELVLGNKQLISLFFVVVALCGVFFAMGYLVGLNSAKAPLASGGDSSSAAAGSASGQRQQPEPPRETTVPPDASAAPAADTPSPFGVETKPALDSGGLDRGTADMEPKGGHFDAAPVVNRPALPVVSAMAPAPAAATGSAPLVEAGASYLQVAALQQRTDADNVIRTLREQSLPAMAARNVKDGLFHVLVGPYRQMSQMAEAKAKLRALGFANAFVQRQ
jgi:hypothetical protein